MIITHIYTHTSLLVIKRINLVTYLCAIANVVFHVKCHSRNQLQQNTLMRKLLLFIIDFVKDVERIFKNLLF